mmetsp:Transcript_14122/g.18855  ORF Transcript_14122/g.18855 Transcript_14122/m.18855 type:complete len:89 (+) Transcript_14122:157-423(+)
MGINQNFSLRNCQTDETLNIMLGISQNGFDSKKSIQYCESSENKITLCRTYENLQFVSCMAYRRQTKMVVRTNSKSKETRILRYHRKH